MQLESNPGPIAAERTYSESVLSMCIGALCCGAELRELRMNCNEDDVSDTVGDVIIGVTEPLRLPCTCKGLGFVRC